MITEGAGMSQKERSQEILAPHRDRVGRGVRMAIAHHGRDVLRYHPVSPSDPLLESSMVAPSLARARVFLCLLTLTIAASSLLPAVTTSPSTPNIDRSEYHTRRLALAAELRKELPSGGTGVVVLHVAPERDNA